VKVTNFSFAALFFLAAAIQFNDPDPTYWVTVYAGTGFVALGKALGRYSDFLTAIVIGGVIAGIIGATPGFLDYVRSGDFGSITGDMRGLDYVEPAREFLGLLIALGLLVSYVRR
jgi:hypothetical protein